MPFKPKDQYCNMYPKNSGHLSNPTPILQYHHGYSGDCNEQDTKRKPLISSISIVPYIALKPMDRSHTLHPKNSAYAVPSHQFLNISIRLHPIQTNEIPKKNARWASQGCYIIASIQVTSHIIIVKCTAKISLVSFAVTQIFGSLREYSYNSNKWDNKRNCSMRSTSMP